MSNQSYTCLSLRVLDQIGQNEISPDELLNIEEHVSECQPCREMFDSAYSSPQWSEYIRPALSEPKMPMSSSSDDEAHHQSAVLNLLGPTDDPNMLGRIGNYEIVGVIGQGGMGAVFKGFDRSLNRFVAIKMLLPHLAASGAARKRFAREGQAVAAVVDDHVMAIHCVDEWQGVPYLVMTYSRGVSLQKRLNDSGPLEVREILRIGMQAAKGLSAAHAHGIVHRDIKPSNILLDQNVERVQLVDFGLARAVDDASLTCSGALAGTPQYMSPEHIGGVREFFVDRRPENKVTELKIFLPKAKESGKLAMDAESLQPIRTLLEKLPNLDVNFVEFSGEIHNMVRFPEHAKNPVPLLEMKVFALQNIAALEAQKIIVELFGLDGPTASVEQRTNTIAVRATTERMAEIEAILMKLDEKSHAILKERSTEKEKTNATSNPLSDLTGGSPNATASSIAAFRRRLNDLEKPVLQVAEQLRASETSFGKDHPDSVKLRADLRALLKQTFVARQEIQRAELVEFSRRLQGMQQTIDARDRIPENIVDRRMEELLDPNLVWSKPESNLQVAEPTVVNTPIPLEQLPTESLKVDAMEESVISIESLGAVAGDRIVDRRDGSDSTFRQ